MPLSDFFTLSTSDACLCADMALWIIPIPPSRAIDIARSDSVTVSMAALSRGIFIFIFFVRLVDMSASIGRISDFAGIRSTSSNVKPTGIFCSIISRL